MFVQIKVQLKARTHFLNRLVIKKKKHDFKIASMVNSRRKILRNHVSINHISILVTHLVRCPAASSRLLLLANQELLF